MSQLSEKCYAAMDDDFNSPVLLAELFEACRFINSVYDGKAHVSSDDLSALRKLMQNFVFDILGLNRETPQTNDMAKLMELIIRLRSEAKATKDYATSDKIRFALQEIGIQLKDSKEETSWNKV
jgi:cysteinyl-tRNA synthetase